jgi:hypothetical protein
MDLMTFCVGPKVKHHTKKWFVLLIFLMLGSYTLSAQTTPANDVNPPKAEIFVGYENIHLSSNFQGASSSNNLNGWATSLTGYFTEHIGGTAEFSAQYGTYNGAGTDLYTTLFGPSFRSKLKGVGSRPVTVFGRALFGTTAGSSGETPGGIFAASGTVRLFTMAFGGGMDINLNRHIAIRPVQLDYVYMRAPIDNQTVHSNGFRYMPGVIFKF